MSLINDKLDEFKERIANPSSMAGTTAIFQFILEGEEGGNYYVAFTDGAGELNEGLAENSDVVLTASTKDFIALKDGKLSPIMAFMGGKIKIKGDMALAMKLQGMLG
ncbi:MAG TPA: SCP2 sterol-binding domain-containing protein [Clostridia bacterium]|nr:SCP2 sterol-binding domain-containing protein [Clostridia bacterium]